MAICNSCGGVIGTDCFNPVECAQITAYMNNVNVEFYKNRIQQACEIINKLYDVINCDTLVMNGVDLSDAEIFIRENYKPAIERSKIDDEDLPF